ncbi:MAG: T9SS type A sorting domain-containing protein [Flavobacteriales bacterium]|nr:T9SS type A sorting domain-containing protein [Flavobacteriales bacterium]
MRHFLLLLTLSTFYLSANCQYFYSEATDIIVTENNQPLTAALNGGFNNAQVNEIDLNLDGILDLVIYDRYFGLVKPYLNDGIPDSVSYTYAPEYAYKFPPLKDFLLTRDYDNDGKMDLFVGSFNIVIHRNTSNITDGLSFEMESTTTIQTVNNTGGNSIDLNPTSANIPGIYDIDGDNDLDLFIHFQSRTVDYHRNLSVDRQNNFIPDYERRNRCWGFFLESSNLAGTISDSVYLDTCHRATRGERIKSPGTQKGQKHGAGLTISPIDIDDNSSTDILIADDGSYKMKLMLNADSTTAQYHTNSRIYKVLDSFPKYDTPVHLLFAGAYFIDVNNDGKKDMIVASNQANSSIPPFSKDDIWYYQNISTNNKYKFQLKTKQFLREQALDFGRTSKPVFIDYNKDGLQDILVGNGGYLSPNDSTIFIEQLALLENTGSKTQAKFELVDRNYIDLPSLNFGFTRDLYAFASPSTGDIDGDGDQDILLTQKNGNIYLFEDTAVAGQEAAFKFHNQPFQFINDRLFTPKSTHLFDIDNDGILELITTETADVSYYPNFGTATIPLFNIPIDSLYWIGGDTMRYHFKEAPNYEMLHIGDSMAINNGQNPDNGLLNALRILKVDTINHYIECFNTIEFGVGDNRFDEFGSNAHMSYFDRKWKFRTLDNGFLVESVFMYKDQGKNQMVIGAPNGNNYFVEDFIDSVQPIDTLIYTKRNFMANFGSNSFIDGTDLNGDSIVDFVIGLNTGGIKILYGSRTTGIQDIFSQSSKSSSFFKAYPNPAKEFVILDIIDNSQQQTTAFELRTISGKLVKSGQFKGKRYRLSTERLSNGIYILTLRNDHHLESKKLVIRP